MVLHGDNTDRYLCSSEDGVAHDLDLTAGATENWFKDSPYTWCAPKGAGSTMVNISERWKRYSVQKRTCILPLVCSLMPVAVANLAHTTVDFDNLTWIAAMQMCEDNDDPERLVHKTSLAFFVAVQKMGSGCSYIGEDDCPCGGHAVFVPSSGARRAFVGCSNWRPGEPLSRKNGHMAMAIYPAVAADRVQSWMEHGTDKLESSDKCSYIAGKRYQEKPCRRHGGKLPPLRRSGGGTCPVLKKLSTPAVAAPDSTVRVIIVLRGTHSDVLPSACHPVTLCATWFKVIHPCPFEPCRNQSVTRAAVQRPGARLFVSYGIRHARQLILLGKIW